MPIMTYGGFKRMTGFCKTHVPKEVEAALESIKDNDEAVKNFGIDLGTRMCKRILDSGTPGLHMYTLNTERSSVAILENLGLINKSQVGSLLLLCAVYPSLHANHAHCAHSGTVTVCWAFTHVLMCACDSCCMPVTSSQAHCRYGVCATAVKKVIWGCSVCQL